MAKIAEQLAVIKISKLIKQTESDELQVFTPELADQISEVLQDLIGDGCVVEVEVGE